MRTLDLVERNFVESRPTAFDYCETAVSDNLAVTRCDGNFAPGTIGRRGGEFRGRRRLWGRMY